MATERLADVRRARADTVEKIATLKREYVAIVKREEGGEDLADAERTKLD